MGEKALTLVTAVNDWSRWYLVPERNTLGVVIQKIKRYRKINGKTQWGRYPAKSYRHMNASDLEAFLRRINATFAFDKKNAEARYLFDHSYVNTNSIEAFERQVAKDVNDRATKRNVIMILNSHVFEFFIIQQKIPDPSRWHLKENEWGDWLLKKDLSAGFYRRVVSTANRFNKFLIDKVYPEMTTPRKLEPIGKAKLGKMEQVAKKESPEKYINAETIKKIIKHFEQNAANLLPNVLLAMAFGLRLSETLGLTKDKLLKDNLLVDEQGDKIEDASISRKLTKTLQRRIPYWNMTAREAWAQIQLIKAMHPNTLNRKINNQLRKFNHTSHDFRRTFITNAFRKNHWKDVKKAAGHTDVRVTMGYDQDDRDLSLEKADLD